MSQIQESAMMPHTGLIESWGVFLPLPCTGCYRKDHMAASSLSGLDAVLDAKEAEGWRLKPPIRCPECERKARAEQVEREAERARAIAAATLDDWQPTILLATVPWWRKPFAWIVWKVGGGR